MERTDPFAAATLLRRCDRLERRIERIEQHLGWSAAPEPQRQPPRAAAAPAMPSIAAPAGESVAAPAGESVAAPAMESVAAPALASIAAPAGVTVAPVRGAPAPLARDVPPTPARPGTPVPARLRAVVPIAEALADGQPPPLTALPPRPVQPASAAAAALPRADVLRYEPKPHFTPEPPPQSAWEQLIGLKLAGWVGAIVLVIGAGLGIKFLYDIGFFTGVSPAVWLSLLSLGAFALIGAGEYVYRTINKISATGLYGAGVAGLFLISYAGHGYYQLYQRETAFILMALATLVGAGVAMRARLVSVAALSLIGGLLAPLVLEGDSNLVVPFLGYLLMLQVVALVLSWWGGTRRWWGLRGLSLAGTCLWTATLIGAGPRPWGPAMGFSILYAGLYHFELILSTWPPRRRAEKRGDSTEVGVVFSVIVTAVLTGAILWIFAGEAPAVRGIWVTALSAATLLIGILLRRNEQTSALAYGYRVQAALLLLLAVPVAFSGAAVCFGWAGVAIALAAMGARTNDRPTRYAAVAAWGLAVVNLIVWAGDAAFTAGTIAYHARTAAANDIWLTLFGQQLAASTIAAALALAGHVVAWFLHSDNQGRNESITLSALASAVFVIAMIIELPPIGATGVILAYAWLLLAADIPTRGRLALLPQSWAILALAVGKWAVIDTLSQRLSPGWSPAQQLPVLNPLMLTGLAIAGSIVAMYRLRREAISRLAGVAPVGVMTLAVALITIGLTLEVDRVVERVGSGAWPLFQTLQMSWTMLWTLALVAFLWLYAKLDRSATTRDTWRSSAWFLAGLLVIKFVLIDTLLWWWGGHRAASGATLGATPGAIVNLQTLAALVLAGGLFIVHRLVRAGETGDRETSSLNVGFAALLVILWAGTLEIDRLVAGGLFPGLAVWPKWQLRQFGWSGWWTAGTIAFLVAACWRDPSRLRRLPLLRTLSIVPLALGIKYLVLDTLFYRLVRGPAPAVVALNLQSFCGALIFAALLLVRHLLDEADESDSAARTRQRNAGAIAMIMLLWLGSLEIDRAFIHWPVVAGLFAQPRVAEQVALSIFWSAFAIGCVFAGFRIRVAGLRYFGLALFALTLVKVGVVDLQGAERGYRILSFMGLGGLLLGTSVLYGKLSPRLLREEEPIANDVQA